MGLSKQCKIDYLFYKQMCEVVYLPKNQQIIFIRDLSSLTEDHLIEYITELSRLADTTGTCATLREEFKPVCLPNIPDDAGHISAIIKALGQQLNYYNELERVREYVYHNMHRDFYKIYINDTALRLNAYINYRSTLN
jgi:hypothetical protein